MTPSGELRGDNRSDLAEPGRMNAMQLINDLFNDLFEKSPEQTAVSRYTAMTGLLYLGAGGLLAVWPGATQTLFRDPAFVGHEEGLIRILGLTVVIIGCLYLVGGRANARQIIAASIVARPILVPVALVPLAIAGVVPHLLLTFAVLDPLLSIGALVLFARRA